MTLLGSFQEAANVDHLGDRKAVLSLSGGADSAAASLYLKELGIEHMRINMDTVWEKQEHYEYLHGPLTKALGPITEIRAELGFADLVRKKGLFPSRVMRFCTTELKVLPAQRFINALVEEGHDIVNVVGIRNDESVERLSPEKIDEIRALELELNTKGRERDEAHGRPFVMRTMFSYHGGDSKHYPLPIDDAVEWANSKRGEWQPSGGDGCARFGLCERAGSAPRKGSKKS